MKAIVYTDPHRLEYLDVPEPVAGPGEVIVDSKAVGICGSELEGVATESPFRVPPLIMGHEFAGIRVDTGEHVVVNPMVACLACDLCDRGMQNICRNRAIIGIQRHGGYGERVAVPEINVVPVDPRVPFTTLALTEPFANAAHALRLLLATDPWPQRVGVIGCGMVGYALAVMARHRGIPEVVVADRSSDRLAFAAAHGADTTNELTGEFDAVFDTVGSAGTRHASLALVRPGGTAMWVGLHEPASDADSLAMIRFEKRVLTSFCYDPTDFRAAARFVGSLSTEFIRVLPLSSGVEAFTELLGGPIPAIKTVLVTE
mgnify:CR=1 FL=1|jgi:Threonine dehydrogenase and related Zn-dependent dehydrogenases